MPDHRAPSRLHYAVLILMALTGISCDWLDRDRYVLTVYSDFDGGSAQVEAIDQETRLVRFKPEPYPDKGWAYWWYMRVDGVRPGETLVLDVGGKHGRFAHPEQAVFSTNQETWTQTPPGEREGERIVYRVPVDARTAWFAWGPPFVPADAERLVERLAADHRFAQPFELATSRGGITIPGLRISGAAASEPPRYGIWIHARQHAWECGSSWVARGFAEWLVGDDPRAQSLRAQAEVTLVPLMDVDSAALGAGGKAQEPHDHNRDWAGRPRYPEVRAAKAAMERMVSENRFDLYVDLHSPGMYDPVTYYLTSPGAEQSAIGRRNTRRFVDASRTEMTGPLTLRETQRIAGEEYTGNWRRMSQNWATAIGGDHVVAVTLEAAWNNPGSSPEGYRALGRQLGLAIERYLRDDPRRPAEGADAPSP